VTIPELVARLLMVPRWIIAGVGFMAFSGFFTFAYWLGGAHEFQTGFVAGRDAAIAEMRAVRAESHILNDQADSRAERAIRAADPVGDPAAIQRLCAEDPACPDR